MGCVLGATLRALLLYRKPLDLRATVRFHGESALEFPALVCNRRRRATEGDAVFCGRAKSSGTMAGNGGSMADVQVELSEKKEENGTKSAEAALLRTGTKGARRRQTT
jgi:hypothetical protein